MAAAPQSRAPPLPPASNTTDEARYGYDAFGNRRTITTADGSTDQVRRLVWDINAPMPMLPLTAEPDDCTHAVICGPDGTLLESHHQYFDDEADFLGHDAPGSITHTVDQDGNPMSQTHRDPWGQATTTQLDPNALDNAFGYTGAYLEPTTGDWHLRARDYQLALGGSPHKIPTAQTSDCHSIPAILRRQPALVVFRPHWPLLRSGLDM